MQITKDAVAVCGLFCGTCPSFLQECSGCLSDNCKCDCFNGFKNCVSKKKITKCYECKRFPCKKLKDFSHKHIVNGICHHENVIHDLKLIKEIGEEKWLELKILNNSCPICKNLKVWYNKNCPHCKE